jgi:hypothetical protein
MTAPQAPAAAPSYTPVLTDLSRLARVPFSPGAVFEEQREMPTWVVPWLIVSVLMIAVGFVMAGYQERAMELAVASRGGQPMPESARVVAKVFTIAGTPIFLLVFSLISAGVMWVALMATGGQVRFRGLMSAAMFSSVMAFIQIVLTSVAVRMRGAPETLQTMADLRVSLGLDLLLSADSQISGFLRGVLAGIGPLQIWALAITAIGVATLERQSKGAAWSAATASYVVLLLVSAVFQGMGG